MTDLNSTDLILVESRVASQGPSMGVAYLCCIFLGYLGIHRFYLKRPITGVMMLLTLGFLGFWVLIDLFLVPGMVRKERERIRAEEILRLQNQSAARAPTPTFVAPTASIDAALVRTLFAERFPV